jgi:hypothetical protein
MSSTLNDLETLEHRIVESAICRLQSDGYHLKACSDGEDRYIRHDAMSAIEACSGTEEAVFFLREARPPLHSVSWCGAWARIASPTSALTARLSWPGSTT